MQQNEALKSRMPGAEMSVRTSGSVQSPPTEAWIDRIKNDLEAVKAQEKIPSGNVVPKKEGTSLELNKESGWLEKLKTSAGEMIRDVVTANDMAKDKFDGNTALMQMARGGITVGIGVGLEKILDETWEAALRGDIKLLYKPDLAIPEEVAGKLRSFGTDTSQRGYYFIREASKDILNSVIYNGLAFFSRPMFQPVEGKHLVRSVLVDAGEALFSKQVPEEVKMSLALSDKEFGSADKNMEAYRHAYTIWLDYAKQTDITKIDISELGKLEGTAEELLKKAMLPKRYQELLEKQGIFRKIAHFSNPPTQLGLNMVIGGAITLWKNIKEVKKVRKEQGGLAGKSVYMPKDEGRRSFGDRKPWTNNREQGNRPPYNKGTVYYGQGRSSVDAKQQEEEDRAKLM